MPEIAQTPEYITRIKLHYNDMRGSEQKLADYLLSLEPTEPLTQSVKQLASDVGVSVASVVRFCQELGYTGYAEFKLMTRQVGFLTTVGSPEMDSMTSAAELKKNICEFTNSSIQKCIQSLDNGELEQAIAAISGAKRLLLCGIGTSAGIAMAAANTFMNLNVDSTPLFDELLMRRTVSMAGPGDVVLGISNCGSVKPIVDALMLAHEVGAMTILITGEKESLACQFADCVLCLGTYGDPSALSMLSVSSCQLLTIQILQTGCFTRSSAEVLEKIRKNTELAEMSRYATTVDEVKKERVRF